MKEADGERASLLQHEDGEGSRERAGELEGERGQVVGVVPARGEGVHFVKAVVECSGEGQGVIEEVCREEDGELRDGARRAHGTPGAHPCGVPLMTMHE